MSLEQISVLLVEDNPGDARLLREAVREARGIRIQLTHCSTLKQAVETLPGQHFDVIMLDLSLPDADGLTTLVRMHTEAPTIPIVVLTGHDDEALALSAVREGAQDYLVKGQMSSHLVVRAMRYATERKRAVEALQRSEEYFRSLIENALDIITVVNADTSIRYASPSFERVLGYAPSSLGGSSILPMIHPENWEMFRDKLRLGGEEPDRAHSFEFQLRHKDGSWRVLEAIGKRLDTPELSGFVLNSRDITERKRAEATLREVNETLRAVINTSPLAIYSLDLQGNVLSWNPAAEKIFGYRADQVLNRLLPTVFEEDLPHHRRWLERASAGGPLESFEARRRRRDGSAVEVSIWKSLLRDGAGTVTGVLALVADNTERKRLEEQFRHSQKMEAVGRLAGGVAHDFNNLLTIITGYCQMQVDLLPSDDPWNEHMQQVLRAADRAAALTRQLLAFSRQQIVQPQVIDLNTLLNDMDRMLKRIVGENIELIIEPMTRPAKVKVDRGQIEQVVVNLAVNARDAMPEGGRLTIETKLSNFYGTDPKLPPTLPPGNYIRMEVSDTGIGMDAHTRSHLFEPFFTTKERGRGTGLGLSTSYGIVKQNQGEILVYSELGIGSVFKIFLPAVEQSLEVQHPISTRRERMRGTETVLVVEDEDGVRQVVVQMLQQEGYHVLTAQSGADALRLCDRVSEPIHLLITDVIMPKMSGRELALKLAPLLPDMKVLFVSGYTDSTIAQHGVLDPGMNFLQKPFTPELLADKVRQVLGTNGTLGG